MVDVSIIIAGTNEKGYVEKCLNSISESNTTYRSEVIVVDNASIDGTAEMVRGKYKDVRLICNKEKKGYIYNNNLAMKDAVGRYILILNADIELKKDTLQTMLDFMEKHPDAAVSSCRLNFSDGDLQLTCRRFPTPFTYISRIPHFFRWFKAGKKFADTKEVRRYLMLDYDHAATRKVNWVLSALFLMRKSVIDEIGMFSDDLVQPFYLEDMDWCFRSHEAGYNVYYIPETSAVHYYQRDSVKKFGWLSIVHMLNIAIFFRNHGWAMLRGRHKKWE